MAPSLESGALHDTEMAPGNPTATTDVGEVGSPEGMTALVIAEAGPVPLALTATTVTT